MFNNPREVAKEVDVSHEMANKENYFSISHFPVAVCKSFLSIFRL